MKNKNNTSAKSTTSTKPAAPVAPEFGEYNGKPTITLKRKADDKYPFTFGASKARLIVQHIEAIKKFAAENAQD